MTIKENLIENNTLIKFKSVSMQDSYNIFIEQEFKFDNELQNTINKMFINHKIIETYSLLNGVIADSVFVDLMQDIVHFKIGSDEIDDMELTDNSHTTSKHVFKDLQFEFNMYTDELYIKESGKEWKKGKRV